MNYRYFTELFLSVLVEPSCYTLLASALYGAKNIFMIHFGQKLQPITFFKQILQFSRKFS